MEIDMERAETDDVYYVDVGQVRITTTWATEEYQIKEWVSDVNKIYRKRGSPRKNQFVLALAADRSLYYPHGELVFNEAHFELLQLCIGVHCLLINLQPWDKWNPKSLRDFLNSFGLKVVGVGIEEVAEKLEKHHRFVMPPVIELQELVEKNEDVIINKGIMDNSKETKRDLSEYNIANLAKIVLGEEINFVKPLNMWWWSEDYYHLSDDLVKFATLETFLVSQMGLKLLKSTTSSRLSPDLVQAFFFKG
ncbi:hypothetical protein UlMin_035881 [Ulmus minor]